MKQIPTPKELLELIKSSLFKDIDIECVLAMTSAQLDTFTLEQEERLLAAQPHGRLVSWLSDLFWTADKEPTLITDPHPWMDNEYDLKEPEDMSDLNDWKEPPEYSGLGSRWEMFFLTDDEAADLVARLESLA